MQAKKELARHRLEKAGCCLKDAVDLLGLESFQGAANRSYYCVFHCMRSVLALEGIDFKKHTAVISYFRVHFIKTGKFEESLSEIIKELFEIRGQSDYEDFFIVSKEEVTQQIKNAEYFFNQIKEYVDKQ